MFLIYFCIVQIPTMYPSLILLHATVRWLLLLLLLLSLYRAAAGLYGRRSFTKADNALRHWTATAAHIQLLAGMLLYTQSPVVRYFWQHFREAVRVKDTLFFGLLHMLLMLAAIAILTAGSALAKRRSSHPAKFRTMLLWYGVALLIILTAIPWPFSPLAQRPYWR